MPQKILKLTYNTKVRCQISVCGTKSASHSLPAQSMEITQNKDFSKKARNARVQAGEINMAEKISVNILLNS